MMLSQETQDLASRLLAYEAAVSKTSKSTESALVRVCEKLRPPLSVLAGAAGYRSLLSRALALAKAQTSTLSAVQIKADGSLQGLGELAPDAAEAGVILIAQLLGLFLNFLGEALTLQLVQDVTPQAEAATTLGRSVPFESLLQEVDQLNRVSERLQLLADQHPFVEEALLSISGNISNTATALEVFAHIKSKSNSLQEDAPKHHPSRRYVM